MSDFRAPPRKKNPLDNRKLHLSAPCPTQAGKGKTSSLQWGLFANNPRLTVWTNDPDDTGEKNGYGKINANLDAPMFFSLLKLLDKVIASAEEYRDKVNNLNYTWFGKQRSDRPVLQSEVWLGKDKEGVIWISVVSSDANRPKIKFEFVPSDFHSFIHGDGTPYTKAETSQLYAQAYAEMLRIMMGNMLVSHWEEPVVKDQGNNNRGGQGGGGYNRGGQGGGSYSNNSSAAPAAATTDYDNDLPF